MCFMGPDVCGRFGSTTKEWCFNVFMSCDDEILKSLASLRNLDPSQKTCTQLERFVSVLYRSRVCNKLNELRWFLYSNIAAEGDHLPPITGSLIPLIHWAYYIAMNWRKAGENHPCFPSPAECGWIVNVVACHVVLCLIPPTHEATMNLVKCG